MKHHLTVVALAAALLAAGCAKESNLPNPTGEGTVRAINAIPGSPSLAFLIEERLIGQVDFKGQSRPATYDDLEYTFNFDLFLPGDATPTRVASQFIDVVKDKDYTMLVTGALAAPDIAVWEADVRQWSEGETVHEVRFAHTSATTGPVDVYFLDTGLVPVLGNQVATLSFSDTTELLEYESAEKVLFLTPEGDDSTILFQSQPLTLLPATTYVLAVFDTDENDIGPVSVVLLNTTAGGSGQLLDVNVQATARFFHASINFPDADIYIDDPLTAPVVAGHTFGDITGDVSIPAGTLPLTYTAAGNVGSILIDVDIGTSEGTRYNVYVLRDEQGEDVAYSAAINRRSVQTQARMSVANTTANHPSVDLYIVAEGTLIDESFPLISALRTQTAPIVFPLPADTYDVYLTEPGEKNVYLGPVPLTLQLGDVLEAIIYDTVDPNTPAWVIAPPP